MVERPILFSAPMVRALLAGTKTQTRRVMARQKQYDFTDYTLFGQQGHNNGDWVAIEHAPDWPDGKEDQCHCPYARRRGDRLWVRETLRRADDGRWYYAADGAPVQADANDHDKVLAMVAWAHHQQRDVCVSIHVPRWASRILLEVTEVRLQRLQEISEADARAEGVEACARRVVGLEGGCSSHLCGYRQVWSQINGPGSWAANPWVWVVEFKRLP